MSYKAITSWSEIGIVPKKSGGNESVTCPNCKTKNKFVISHDKGLGGCFKPSCQSEFGQFKLVDSKGEIKQSFVPALHTAGEKIYKLPEPPPLPSKDANEKMYAYFAARKISKETCLEMNVHIEKIWIQGGKCEIDGKVVSTADGVQNCITFPYLRNFDTVNNKYRSGTKAFKLVKDAELILYNYNALLAGYKEIIVTEGEPDALSWIECGIKNVVSVPNGASKNANLSYLDNCVDLLNEVETFIIATDDDEAGNLLAEELIRRLGREKCRRLQYPVGCKDSNETLQKHGKETMHAIYEKATELRISGILDNAAIDAENLSLYLNGYPKTYKSGIVSFDDIYTVKPGEVTIFTGGANAGKSTYINEILQRYNYFHGFKAGVLSWEEQPVGGHLATILERYWNKTFFEPNQTQLSRGLERMTLAERKTGADYYTENYKFFDCRGTRLTVKKICEMAKQLVKMFGIKILYIDPFTHIDRSDKPKGVSDTDYIGHVLIELSVLAKDCDIAVFLVAHPTKSRTLKFNYIDSHGKDAFCFFGGKGDINGSVNFENTADNIIALGRHPENNNPIVITEKIRYQQYVGKIGHSELIFKDFGRYTDFTGLSDCNFNNTKIIQPIKQELTYERNTNLQPNTDFGDGFGDVPF